MGFITTQKRQGDIALKNPNENDQVPPEAETMVPYFVPSHYGLVGSQL